jgi:ParB-like chromosome segregation protein Spo0J
MIVEQVALQTLTEDPANVRIHSPRNVAALKESLQRFGQQKPIVVGSDNVVIAGNGTLRAAKELGWETVGIVRSKLKGADAIAFAVADNRTAELAVWDSIKLEETLDFLVGSGISAEALGFDVADLRAMTGGVAFEAVPELTIKEGTIQQKALSEKVVVMIFDLTLRAAVVELVSKAIEENGWEGSVEVYQE